MGSYLRLSDKSIIKLTEGGKYSILLFWSKPGPKTSHIYHYTTGGNSNMISCSGDIICIECKPSRVDLTVL